MSYKTYIFIAVLIVVAFAAGKYSSSKDVKTKEVINDNKIVDTKTVQTTEQVKKKDGTIQTVVVTDTVQSVKDKETINTDTIVKSASPRWNVSAMVGEDLTNVLSGPKYGVSVTRQFIGFINIGGFAFTNGLIGVSLGVSF